MRFIVMVKANKDSESGVLPTEEQLREMGKFNDELPKRGHAGGEVIQPSSKGVRHQLRRPPSGRCAMARSPKRKSWSSVGRTPDSESLLAFTITMKRIASVSLSGLVLVHPSAFIQATNEPPRNRHIPMSLW